MNFDWKNIVKAVAPTIGTALGGPLAGLGIKALSEALLGKEDGTEAEVAAAVAGANPEQLMAMKKADQDFAIKMKELDIDLDKAFIADTSDARHADYLANYANARREAYPSIEDQLDMLYHGGFDAWKAAIDAVKQQYPKPAA